MKNTEKAIKITKVQRFEDIKALLAGNDAQYGTTPEVAIEVIDHEIELLAKKNAGESAKQAELRKLNETLQRLIIEHLTTLAEDDRGRTCSQLGEEIPALYDLKVQKIAYLVTNLASAGRVTATSFKGKTYYKLA